MEEGASAWQTLAGVCKELGLRASDSMDRQAVMNALRARLRGASASRPRFEALNSAFYRDEDEGPVESKTEPDMNTLFKELFEKANAGDPQAARSVKVFARQFGDDSPFGSVFKEAIPSSGCQPDDGWNKTGSKFGSQAGPSGE